VAGVNDEKVKMKICEGGSHHSIVLYFHSGQWLPMRYLSYKRAPKDSSC